MHAADAAKHAAAALHEADRYAQGGFAETATSLVAVADGWTRLAATLAEHLIMPSTEVRVRTEARGPSEDALRRAGRFGSWADTRRA